MFTRRNKGAGAVSGNAGAPVSPTGMATRTGPETALPDQYPEPDFGCPGRCRTQNTSPDLYSTNTKRKYLITTFLRIGGLISQKLTINSQKYSI